MAKTLFDVPVKYVVSKYLEVVWFWVWNTCHAGRRGFYPRRPCREYGSGV